MPTRFPQDYDTTKGICSNRLGVLGSRPSFHRQRDTLAAMQVRQGHVRGHRGPSSGRVSL
jgi:hypothetical protein